MTLRTEAQSTASSCKAGSVTGVARRKARRMKENHGRQSIVGRTPVHGASRAVDGTVKGLALASGFGCCWRGNGSALVGTRALPGRRSGSQGAVGTAFLGVVTMETCADGKVGTLPLQPHLDSVAHAAARIARGLDEI